MSGQYFHPIKRIFLNLSGGTVTGDTVFTEGVYSTRLSGGTIFSGSTPLEVIINNIATGATTQGKFLPLSGGTGGEYNFTGVTTADTINIITTIEPTIDNIVYLGSPIKRFRSLNVVDGVAVSFTASTRVKTNQLELGNRLNINDNFIISGGTGLISTYGGTSGAGLSGKFLSGTSTGFVVADIADIADIATSTDSYTTGATWIPNTLTLKLNQGKPDVTVSIGTFNTLVATGNTTLANVSTQALSANTIYSGNNVSLETIIYNIASSTESITSIQPGSNITTGGTLNSPIVSVVASPSFNTITFSGSAIGGNVQAAAGTFTSLSATTLSGGTILSGSTNLYSIFQKIGDVDGVANVNAGTNITTGGTATSPIINLVASPSVNNLTFSGTATGGNIFATQLSGATIYSGSTDLYNIFVGSVTAGSNVTIGGTASNPTVGVIASPSFAGLVSATGFTDSSLTAGRVVYVGASGRLVDEAGFEYDAAANLLKAGTIQVGTPGTTGTTATIYGDVLVIGQAISGFTSELYIEDNLIELNYNPTASTESTSLGAGWSIQDGSGTAGTDVLWDIRGTATGLANRSFSTNLGNIRVLETGTVSSPNGLYVLKSTDIIDGGTY